MGNISHHSFVPYPHIAQQFHAALQANYQQMMENGVNNNKEENNEQFDDYQKLVEVGRTGEIRGLKVSSNGTDYSSGIETQSDKQRNLSKMSSGLGGGVVPGYVPSGYTQKFNASLHQHAMMMHHAMQAANSSNNQEFNSGSTQ